MAVIDLQSEQQRALPREDLSPYEGQWVALREGHVIASDLDVVSLRANPDVHSDDALLPVPRDGDALLIL